MSVNLKQVYNAIHDLGREIVMLESHDDGIGIAFETDGGIIRCEFDGARKLTGIFVDKNKENDIMKKIIAAILAAMIILTLGACGAKDEFNRGREDAKNGNGYNPKATAMQTVNAEK